MLHQMFHNIKRGEVWLVNLDPTLGHEIKKSRPSVIVQNDVGNAYSPITIIAPITSQNTEKVYPFEVLLTSKKEIEKPSKVLLNQLRAIDKARLVKKLGKLDEHTMILVDEAIQISLGLIKIQ